MSDVIETSDKLINETIIKTDNLSKSYKGRFVVKNISIEIKKGDIYGLIGPNGAGKTTFLRILTGLSLPSHGTFSFFGKTEEKDIAIARAKMGALVEVPSVIPHFSAYKNLLAQSLLFNMKRQERKVLISNLLQFVGLANETYKQAKNLSLGMKQRLGIAIALVNNPDFLILDEPINGLDPQGIIDIRDLIKKLQASGKTILICSHILSELALVINKIGIINRGVLISQHSTEEIDKLLNRIYYIKSDKQDDLILHFTNSGYEVKKNPAGYIEVYNYPYKQFEVVKELMNLGFDIEEINEKKDTLESYFIKKIEENDREKLI
jgi:ABC-2 type transport system ATP-binding protein